MKRFRGGCLTLAVLVLSQLASSGSGETGPQGTRVSYQVPSYRISPVFYELFYDKYSDHLNRELLHGSPCFLTQPRSSTSHNV